MAQDKTCRLPIAQTQPWYAAFMLAAFALLALCRHRHPNRLRQHERQSA
jgi:hypothetical protein